MKALVVNYKLEIIGAIAGSALGFTYWYFVGCASGTCAITSNPVRSSLYGALLGALVLGLFKTDKNKTQKT